MVNGETRLDKLFVDANRLTLKAACDRALQFLVKNQQNMQVLVGQPGTFMGHAALLYDDALHESLILDALTPDAANAYALAGEDLLLWTDDALPLGFQTVVVEQLIWQRFAAIRIQRPEMVFQWQRRSTLRAVVDSSNKTSVILKRYGARDVEGECVDIGAGGMRIGITAPQDYPVTQGELLARVQFKFQGQGCSVEAKVCHLGPGIYTQGGVQQLGLAFIHLPVALEDKIIQYTLRYDRECLRRASR